MLRGFLFLLTLLRPAAAAVVALPVDRPQVLERPAPILSASKPAPARVKHAKKSHHHQRHFKPRVAPKLAPKPAPKQEPAPAAPKKPAATGKRPALKALKLSSFWQGPSAKKSSAGETSEPKKSAKPSSAERAPAERKAAKPSPKPEKRRKKAQAPVDGEPAAPAGKLSKKPSAALGKPHRKKDKAQGPASSPGNPFEVDSPKKKGSSKAKKSAEAAEPEERRGGASGKHGGGGGGGGGRSGGGHKGGGAKMSAGGGKHGKSDDGGDGDGGKKAKKGGGKGGKHGGKFSKSKPLKKEPPRLWTSGQPAKLALKDGKLPEPSELVDGKPVLTLEGKRYWYAKVRGGISLRRDGDNETTYVDAQGARVVVVAGLHRSAELFRDIEAPAFVKRLVDRVQLLSFEEKAIFIQSQDGTRAFDAGGKIVVRP